MKNVIFATTFVATVLSTLDQKCPVGSGTSISSGALAEELNLGEGMEALFVLLFRKNLLPGWEMSRERRGIGRVGEKRAPAPPKAEPPRARREKESDSDFRTKLIATLASCVPQGKIVTRTEVGDAYGKPCGETEVRISAQFRKLGDHRVLLVDSTTGYITKKGPYGGICRLSVDELASYWTLAKAIDAATAEAEAKAQAEVAEVANGEGEIVNEAADTEPPPAPEAEVAPPAEVAPAEEPAPQADAAPTSPKKGGRKNKNKNKKNRNSESHAS